MFLKRDIINDDGPIKVNKKMAFFGLEIWKPEKSHRVRNCKLKTLRFNAYFNITFNLFFSNCSLLVFGFLQDSVKTEIEI